MLVVSEYVGKGQAGVTLSGELCVEGLGSLCFKTCGSLGKWRIHFVSETVWRVASIS